MGILDNIERGLEKAVNGAFAKTFRSGLQPVEIAAALKNEADTRAQVISRERILIPNSYTVSLSPEDFARLNATNGSLRTELTSVLTAHARSQHYAFPGPVSIVIEPDSTISVGMSQIGSGVLDANVPWTPAIDVAGKLYPVRGPRTVIGRGSSSDIVVNDPGVSKQHLAILWDTRRAVARDLGSTNGTTLGGQKIAEAELLPDTSVRIGHTSVTFRLVPQGQFGGIR